jgi:hypothetical protein
MPQSRQQNGFAWTEKPSGTNFSVVGTKVHTAAKTATAVQPRVRTIKNSPVAKPSLVKAAAKVARTLREARLKKPVKLDSDQLEVPFIVAEV